MPSSRAPTRFSPMNAFATRNSPLQYICRLPGCMVAVDGNDVGRIYVNGGRHGLPPWKELWNSGAPRWVQRPVRGARRSRPMLQGLPPVGGPARGKVHPKVQAARPLLVPHDDLLAYAVSQSWSRRS